MKSNETETIDFRSMIRQKIQDLVDGEDFGNGGGSNPISKDAANDIKSTYIGIRDELLDRVAYEHKKAMYHIEQVGKQLDMRLGKIEFRLRMNEEDPN